MRRHAYQLLAGIICIVVVLGGTATAAQDPADFILYKTDFASDGAGFYFYPVDDGSTPCIPGEPGTPASPWSRAGCRAFVPWVDGHIESHGPWWVDPNHLYDPSSAFPGAGFLNVLAFVWHGTHPLDLTDATVRFRMILQNADLKGGRIHFWFQAPCVPSAHQTCEFAFADYALEAPIDQVLTPNAWTGLSLQLPASESEWRCLGTHPGGIYGCVPIADALKKVENFGFILLPVSPDPDGTNSASGSLGIDDIEIVRSPIEHVTWTSPSGVVATGNTLTKTGGPGWNAGAVSNKAFVDGEGFVEFTANGIAAARTAGLSSGDSSATAITWAVRLTETARVEIYESGALVGDFGPYENGDRFRVGVEAGVVRYRRNGAVFSSSTLLPTYPLRAVASLFSPGAVVADAIISGHLARNVAWTGVHAALASGNTLTKTGGAGWNAGGVSTQSIPLGSGYVEFVAGPEGGTAVGLTSASVAQGAHQIGFALLLGGDGQLQVVESGTSRGTFGAWSPGDRMRIAVDAGTMTYSRNSQVLFTSDAHAVYPLIADASILTPGASVSNAHLFGGSERVAWANVTGVTTAGTSASKPGPSGWNAGAISTRALVSGDGYMEFTASGDYAYRIAGLGQADLSASLEDVDFGILLTADVEGDEITVYESGQIRGSFGRYLPGDRLRVGIESGVVRYWHNGAPIYTSTVPPVYPLVVDTSLYTTGASISDVILSGEIADGLWGHPFGVSITGTTLTKTATVGWNAAVISTRKLLAGDGFMEFTAIETDTSRIAGLGWGTPGLGFEDINLGILLTAEGTIAIYESGQFLGGYGGYSTGDRFRVSVSGGVVRYWRNGTLLRVSAQVPQYPLEVMASLFNEQATLADVLLVGIDDHLVLVSASPEPVAWASTVGVAATGNNIVKSGAMAWNSGAISTRAILSGDGYAEFTATGVNGYRIVGLSNGDAGQDFEDVDFGILLTAEGSVVIYEAGEFRGAAGYYVTGDRFRVSVSSGLVQYWRNNTVIHATTRQPHYPLVVDSSFFTTGTGAGDVVIAGTLGGAAWTSVDGVVVTGDTLTKTAGQGWNAGALSIRRLSAGDGFMEFTAAETVTNRIGGLGQGDTVRSFVDVDFGIMLTDVGSFAIYEAGEYVGSGGYYATGDRFRVTLTSGIVRYWKNGHLLRTSGRTPSGPLRAVASFYSPGATLEDVRLFDAADPVPWDAQGSESVTWASPVGVTTTGNTLTRNAGLGWTAGAVSTTAILQGDGFTEFTASGPAAYRISGLSNGDSSQDFTDVDFGLLLTAEGQVVVYEAGESKGIVGSYIADDRFRVGVTSGVVSYWQNGVRVYTSMRPPSYPLLVDTSLFSGGAILGEVTIAGTLGAAVWNGAMNVAVAGATLTKAGSTAWNAGAVSSRLLAAGDGFMEFTAAETDTYRIAGLTRADSVSTFEQIDFGILLTAEGQIAIYEEGTYVGAFGTYASGSRFRVAVGGGRVRYWQDGRLFHSSARPPLYPVRAGAALFSPAATVADMTFTQLGLSTPWSVDLEENVTWTAATGVAIAGNTLTRDSSTGWNAGAVSTKAIGSGNGYVEFTAQETTTYRILGLSHGDTEYGYADIDFGILLTLEGIVVIYEEGEYFGGFGPYAPGDRFRVSVTDGVVRYWRNGVLLFTTTRQPGWPLLVDTSLFSPGATLLNVVISGSLQ